MKAIQQIMLPLILFFILSPSLQAKAAEDSIINIPWIESKREAEAIRVLDSMGIEADFWHCYSKSVPKGFVIPGSQYPRGNSPIRQNDRVTANISLGPGPLPNLTGLSLNESLMIIDKESLSFNYPVVFKGRSTSVPEGHVYNQDPSYRVCFSPEDRVKLFVNSPLYAKITYPLQGENVTDTVRVNGTIYPEPSDHEHLWIAVRPGKAQMNWWPQTGGPLTSVQGEFKGEVFLGSKEINSRKYIDVAAVPVGFEGEAFLGGEKGDIFDIALLVVDDDTNAMIQAWIANCRKSGKWPPINEEDPVTKTVVPKAVIEKSIYDKVVVRLLS